MRWLVAEPVEPVLDRAGFPLLFQVGDRDAWYYFGPEDIAPRLVTAVDAMADGWDINFWMEEAEDETEDEDEEMQEDAEE